MTRRARRTPLTIVAVLATVVLVIGGTGFLLFSRASSDPLRHVDAIVVLAGEHDGREDYAIELARQGLAPVVVLSNPYPADDPVMRRVCAGQTAGVEVICGRPAAFTTRGEATMLRHLADQRHWQSLMVVTWRFHLVRARLIFSQCFSDSKRSVVMRAVPGDSSLSLTEWVYIYLYQYGALAKAIVQGPCT